MRDETTGDQLEKLRRLVNQQMYKIYQAVKADRTAELSGEALYTAAAIREHLQLPGVHNALEFADVRDGQSYEMHFDDGPLSPLAHIACHAAVLGMLDQNKDAQAAFQCLLTEKGTTSKHHAIHVLTGLLLGFYWVESRRIAGLPTPLDGDDADTLKGDFASALNRICSDVTYREKLAEKFPATHWDKWGEE